MCERQFLTSFRHFYVLDENRTCSVSIRLDQKSRQFLIFPRSILQNIFTKWPLYSTIQRLHQEPLPGEIICPRDQRRRPSAIGS